MEFHIVVCGGIAPDPLQTIEPVAGAAGPGLKNEMMLPAVFDPWAAHALFEAGRLVKENPGSKLWVVALGPKAKLQQVMMTVAQKLPFELVAVDAAGGGFTDSALAAAALAGAIEGIAGLDKRKLLLFGGWESATRGAGTTLARVARKLGITDLFLGVDELKTDAAGALTVKERIAGGNYQVSACAGAPAACGWATGNLPEPPNDPKTGMANMRTMMPSLQKAKPAQVTTGGIEYANIAVPQQQRQTAIVKDKNPREVAEELAAWIRK